MNMGQVEEMWFDDLSESTYVFSLLCVLGKLAYVTTQMILKTSLPLYKKV